MVTHSNSNISIRRALWLGLIVLAVYFPVIIYVNVPAADILVALQFLFPHLLVTYVLYFVFILSAGRMIDQTERLLGENFLLESQLPAIFASVPVALLASILSHFLFSWSIQLILWIGADQISLRPQTIEQLQRTNNGITFVIILSISYLIINRKTITKIKSLELQAQQLTNEKTAAQYEALKNQVSPHFLFNSLSILSSLVHISPDLSEKFIDQLSKAYRYILEQKDNDLVSLETELDFVKAYAYLLQIRFDNKFQLDVQLSDEDARSYNIAPLTLQLLLENTVKHNRMSDKEPLQVKISRAGSFLVVSNPVRPRFNGNTVSSTGIGLVNIANRYKLLTKEPVSILNRDGNFEVKIPLVK
jgi:two-component system LytT family sensor kinase